MSGTLKLGDHPALQRWYEATGRGTGVRTVADELAWRTCEALAAPDAERARRFVAGFETFLRLTSSPLADFLAAEALFQNNGAALVDVISDLGEFAVRYQAADAFLGAMRSGADATGLVVLRFLSAWIALNAGRLEICVDECEKVTEPFASIYTIQGQALLELSRVEEAVDALGVAVRLSPNELLAWFQLAKAHHVAGRPEAAWTALRECHKLAPQSDEVALFMAIVAADPALALACGDDAWRALRPRLAEHASNAQVATALLKLALRRERREEATKLVHDASWDRMASDAIFTRELPTILRGFQARGWMDVAAAFLQKVVPPGEKLA